jgi:hypothetical protein
MKRLKERKQLNVAVQFIMGVRRVRCMAYQRLHMAGLQMAGVCMEAMRIIMGQALAQVIQTKKTHLLVR